MPVSLYVYYKCGMFSVIVTLAYITQRMYVYALKWLHVEREHKTRQNKNWMNEWVNDVLCDFELANWCNEAITICRRQSSAMPCHWKQSIVNDRYTLSSFGLFCSLLSLLANTWKHVVTCARPFPLIMIIFLSIGKKSLKVMDNFQHLFGSE